jgi:hypothetical protein
MGIQAPISLAVVVNVDVVEENSLQVSLDGWEIFRVVTPLTVPEVFLQSFCVMLLNTQLPILSQQSVEGFSIALLAIRRIRKELSRLSHIRAKFSLSFR